MKRILLYTVLFLLLCCISSCLDDKNDFNYKMCIRDREKRMVDLDEYVGWVDGRYVFNNRPLGEIMQTFERW